MFLAVIILHSLDIHFAEKNMSVASQDAIDEHNIVKVLRIENAPHATLVRVQLVEAVCKLRNTRVFERRQ